MMDRLNLHIDRSLVRLWLVMAVAALASLADVMDAALYHPDPAFNFIGIACVAVLKATVITALYAVCRRNLWLKWPAIAVIVAFVALSLLNGGCWLFYDFGITRKLLTLIAETNPDEIREFMPELADKSVVMVRSPWLWLSLAVAGAAWVGLPRIPRKVTAFIVGTLSTAGLGYLIYVFATRDGGRADYSVFARSYRCAAAYIGNHRRIRELQALKLPLPHPETLRSDRAAERMTVVIGESASRDHLSLYGYRLPTTPGLDSIAEGIYRLDGAVASSTLTSDNIPRLVSFMTDEPGSKEWYEFPSLIQVFHRLGFRTYWLSNQEFSGKWSNLSSILSLDADVVRYVGAMDSEDYGLGRQDDVLLPEWKKTSAEPDSLQLTFLHLMGSHFQYFNRYPDERSKFTANDILQGDRRKWLDEKKAGIIAEYDNSILYTDSILGVVIDDIRNSKTPSVLVYVSDHGENVYDDRDYRGRDPKFVDVPFIIYANDAYRERNPEILKDIEAARNTPFSTSELPQLLMHLTGTRYQMYDSVRDPLSKAFKPRKRWVDGEVYYQDAVR